MPGGKAFRDKFTAKYGPIQTYAPYAYDAATAMITAMEKAGSAEPAKVLAELSKIRFAGVTGEIGFDAKGDVLGGAITLYRVKDGKWVVVETVMSSGPSKP
jgi:branched-chain amino acid transport system substrate-binding protein